MARPRKPAALKLVAGTTRPDRDGPAPVELPLIEHAPPAPDWMPNAHAVREWDRIAPVLVANKLLTEVGLAGLAHMCALHGKIVQLHAAGETPNAALIAQWRALYNDYGATPVAQGKVRPGASDAKTDNPFKRGPKDSAAG